jgi:NAD(P)-dependent dehydrogenase (short-subunit alcohol dehydrogenase family)
LFQIDVLITSHQVERPRPPPPTVKEDASYLIIGGTGGLGKAIIRHLVKIGARHIIAMSRSGAGDEDTLALIDDCRTAGVDVVIQRGSVLSTEDLLETVALAGKRQIRGVIQGAMVLKVKFSN